MTEMHEKPGLNRRDFLKAGAGTAAAGLAAASGLAEIVPPRVLGANDRVRVAVIGLHGRGNDHIKELSGLPNVEIAALCDVYEPILNQRLDEITKMGRPRPKGYQDLRKLFDDQSIDAVTIATPNHWHSLAAIWACQAGKDVYVEKPCSHNLWEGRQLVRAANRYNRIVQHGTQIRSSAGIRSGIEKMQSGSLIGDVYMARGLCFKWRDTIGHAPPSAIPQVLDYDIWQGPAPQHVFTKNRFLYNWHWFWWYGNGDLGNQGIHQIDVARWGLGLKFPNKISAIGGHFLFDDDQQTPNTLNCAFEYHIPNGKPRMMEFEVRGWMTNGEAGIGESGPSHPPKQAENRPKLGPGAGSHNAVGDIFYGSKGYMSVADEDDGNYKTWLGKDREPGPSGHGGGSHFANWIDAVRSRRAQDLHAPIEEGYISCGLMQLANASYRLGRTIEFDPETEEVIGDKEAAVLLRDGDRGYRAPFVIPENI